MERSRNFFISKKRSQSSHKMTTMMLKSLRLTGLLVILLLPGESLIQGSYLYRTNDAPRTSGSRLNEVASKAQEEDVVTQGTETPSNHIVVTSEMEMDIPIQVCFDAFSDLPRQPSWSPWLHSVSYDEKNPHETVWKMRYLGLPISWRSISTNNQRPHVIEWKSIKGLKNFGRVDFTQLTERTTHMKLTLTFEVPRIAAHVLTQSPKTTRMVEDRMLRTTLQNFRNVVLENDMKE
jgi:uncharacterized membrane protein